MADPPQAKQFTPEEIFLLMQQIKQLVTKSPQEAAKFLEMKPPLLDSILQAQLIMGMVKKEEVDAIISPPQTGAMPPPPRPPPAATPQDTEQDRKRILMERVVKLTEEELAKMPPEAAEKIRELRRQIGVG
eukprot:m.87330 g.87330  ORF g.87330 m.87330 type:complete len:131 (-) comp13102_c0_seq2:94-486(-)